MVSAIAASVLLRAGLSIVLAGIAVWRFLAFLNVASESGLESTIVATGLLPAALAAWLANALIDTRRGAMKNRR